MFPWVPLCIHRVTNLPPISVRTERFPIVDPNMWYEKEKQDGLEVGDRRGDKRSEKSLRRRGCEDSINIYDPSPVWSPSGPVPSEGVELLLKDQSKLSVFPWLQEQRLPSSKLHSTAPESYDHKEEESVKLLDIGGERNLPSSFHYCLLTVLINHLSNRDLHVKRK